MRTVAHSSAALLLALALALPAAAQFGNSGFNTNQSGSNSSFGSNSGFGGGVTAGQRTFSGSGSNNQLGTGTSQAAADGTLSGSERFIRGNRQGQFVGADSGDASGNPYSQTGQTGQSGQFGQSGLGGSGLNGMNSMNSRGRLGSQLNQLNQQGFGQQGFNQGFGQNGFGTSSRTQVRATLVVGFNAPKPPASVIGTRLETHLSTTRGLERLGPIQVEVQGRLVVLRGTVRTEHDRLLAEQLALLEPGVGEVQNELQVPPDAPAGRE
jgi:hypothetical protein